MQRDFDAESDTNHWRIRLDSNGPVDLDWDASAVEPNHQLLMIPIEDLVGSGAPIDMAASRSGLTVQEPGEYLLVYGEPETVTLPLQRGWNWLPMPLAGANTLDAVLDPIASLIGPMRWRFYEGTLIPDASDLFPKATTMLYCSAAGTTAAITGLRTDARFGLAPYWRCIALPETLPPNSESLAAVLANQFVFEWLPTERQYRHITLGDGMLKDRSYHVRRKPDYPLDTYNYAPGADNPLPLIIHSEGAAP